MNVKYKSFIYDGVECTHESEIVKKLEINPNVSWLLLCEFEDSEIEIKNNTVIWKNGSFYSGDWHYGIWLNGSFYGGVWESGIFENGVFSGKWKDGIRKTSDEDKGGESHSMKDETNIN